MNLKPEKRDSLKKSAKYIGIFSAIMLVLFVFVYGSDNAITGKAEIEMFQILEEVVYRIFPRDVAEAIMSVWIIIGWFGGIPSTIALVVIWLLMVKKLKNKVIFISCTYGGVSLITVLCGILVYCIDGINSNFGFAFLLVTHIYIAYFAIYSVLTIAFLLTSLIKFLIKAKLNKSNKTE